MREEEQRRGGERRRKRSRQEERGRQKRRAGGEAQGEVTDKSSKLHPHITCRVRGLPVD